MPTAVQWGMLRKSPRCMEMGMLRQSPHSSVEWGCYEIVPTTVQGLVKVAVKPSVKNETTPFAALEAADKWAWQSITASQARRAGVTTDKIKARLSRIALEGWTFQVYFDERFCELMELFYLQVCLCISPLSLTPLTPYT